MEQIEKRYQEALDYIYTFVDYSLTRGFRYAEDQFDLGRMTALMRLLNNPQNDYPIIHVAGTKGKGSTCAFLASALKEADYKVGFYSSPHLHDFCERFQINNSAISHKEFVECIEILQPNISKIEKLTTFEIATALGFLFFSRHKVDVAVIEVGLGGRLDATNIVNPIVSVITSISLDHMAVLGNTIEKIAFEKAGIIKPGIPIVCAPQVPSALDVIAKVALEKSSPFIDVSKHIQFHPGKHNLKGQTFSIEKEKNRKAKGRVSHNQGIPFQIPLLGQHQIENAITAYTALTEVIGKTLPITQRQIQMGFKKVNWPCRFEILQHDPLLIVDSAHNKDSAKKLYITMNDYLPDYRIVLIFGASEDKDIDGMLNELSRRVNAFIMTQSTHPRAMSAEKLVLMQNNKQIPTVARVPIERALREAFHQADNETAIIVAGSLFIASAVKEVWLQTRTV